MARQLKPNDKDALEKFKAADKEVKREAFEKAIHADEPQQTPLAEQLDPATISVEESYAGPRPSWPLDEAGVREIAQHMQAQKTLHARYV